MSVTLMYKDKKALTFEDRDGVPCGVRKVDTPELLPVCLRNNADFDNVVKWLRRRRIPDDRAEYTDDIKEKIRIHCRKLKNCEPSFTDGYWISRLGASYKTASLSKEYSTFVGDLFFEPWKADWFDRKQMPDLTTGGRQIKRWIRLDNKDYLIKAGRENSIEVLSELIVTYILDRMNFINHVNYSPYICGGGICSMSENFVPIGMELVPASDFIVEGDKAESFIDTLLNACEREHIPDAEEFVKKERVIDALFGNSSRTYDDICFLYDTEKREFRGPAPMFDYSDSFMDFTLREQTDKALFKILDLSALTDDDLHQYIYAYPGADNKVKDKVVKLLSALSKA